MILVAMVFISLGIVSVTAVVAARGLDGTPAVGVGVAGLVLIELVVAARFLGGLRDELRPSFGRPEKGRHGVEDVIGREGRGCAGHPFVRGVPAVDRDRIARDRPSSTLRAS